MTSTTEPCGCGCGLLIGPRDPHPWFKTQTCQILWGASLKQPEDRRRQWMAEQRFFAEMVSAIPWGDRGAGWEFEITRNYIIDIANTVMADAGLGLRRFEWEDNESAREAMLEDALRILAYRYEKMRAPEWVSYRGMVPEWAVVQQAPRFEPAIEYTMTQVGLLRQDADAVTPF